MGNHTDLYKSLRKEKIQWILLILWDESLLARV